MIPGVGVVRKTAHRELLASAASARLAIPVFSRMSCTWRAAVSGLMNNRSPISWLVNPRYHHDATAPHLPREVPEKLQRTRGRQVQVVDDQHHDISL